MNAKHPPGPPMTLGNMRGGAARSASSETNGCLISLRACLTVFCAGERRMITCLGRVTGSRWRM